MSRQIENLLITDAERLARGIEWSVHKGTIDAGLQ